MDKHSVERGKSLNNRKYVRIAKKTSPFFLLFCTFFSFVFKAHSLDRRLETVPSTGDRNAPSGSISVQQKQINGMVKDAQGESVIGANIVEVGTTNGTKTDTD